MAEESIFVCTMCPKETFASFEELSSHMESEHEPRFTNYGNNLHNAENNTNETLHKVNHSFIKTKTFENIPLKLNGNVSRMQRSIFASKDDTNVRRSPTKPMSRSCAIIDLTIENSNLEQSPTPRFECSECGKEVASAHNLQRHKLVHTQEKNFICEFCGHSFKREDILKDHRCVINEEGMLARIKRTRNQEEILNEQVALVCPVCGKRFANISNRNKHCKTHEEKTEVCPECGKRFHLKPALKDHILQVHKGGTMLTCPVCQKELKGRNSLYTHLVRFHPEQRSRPGPQKHSCPDCGRLFYQKGNLRKHRLTHSDVLKYTCNLCDSAFRFPEQLRRHTLKHDTNNRHPCHMCNRSFTMVYELKNHVEIYHGGMSYVCKYCLLTCKHLQAFRQHLQRRHEDEEAEWNEGGTSFLKSCRVANDHYVNIQTVEGGVNSESNSDVEDQTSASRSTNPRTESRASPEVSSYLGGDRLSGMEALDDLISISTSSVGSTINYFDAPVGNDDGKIRSNRVAEVGDDHHRSSFVSRVSSFNLVGQTSAFKETKEKSSDFENLIMSANLAEFISFPVSDGNGLYIVDMDVLDECS